MTLAPHKESVGQRVGSSFHLMLQCRCQQVEYSVENNYIHSIIIVHYHVYEIAR